VLSRTQSDHSIKGSAIEQFRNDDTMIDMVPKRLRQRKKDAPY